LVAPTVQRLTRFDYGLSCLGHQTFHFNDSSFAFLVQTRSYGEQFSEREFEKLCQIDDDSSRNYLLLLLLLLLHHHPRSLKKLEAVDDLAKLNQVAAFKILCWEK
jgi:hypothetical protein